MRGVSRGPAGRALNLLALRYFARIGVTRSRPTPGDGTVVAYSRLTVPRSARAQRSRTAAESLRMPSRSNRAVILPGTSPRLSSATARAPSLSGFDQTWSSGGPSRAPGLVERSEEHTSELQSRLHLVC